MGFCRKLHIFWALMILLASGRALADAPTVTFTITDELAEPQIDEEIAVRINHVAVGTLHVGRLKPRDSFTVTVPAADVYHYDLCGHLDEADDLGRTVKHKIDNGGDLTDLNGRALYGFNSMSVEFYLLDQTPGKAPVEVDGITAGHSCADVVAMR